MHSVQIRHTLAVLIALMMLVITPATAAPATDSLAAQLPDSTFFYVSARTDDAYFDSLNGVLARFHPLIEQLSQFDTELQSAASINMTTLLEEFARTTFDTDFTNDIRPWLGDSVAMAIFSDSENRFQGVIAVRITERGAAEDFVRRTLPEGIRPDVNNGFNIYGPAEDEGVFAVGDDVMYFASNIDAVPFETSLADSLKQDPDFSAGINSLPSANYNITGFVDISAMSYIAGLEINTVFNEMLNEIDPSAPQSENTIVQQPPLDMVFGATIKDGRALIFDTVFSDISAYTQGIDLPFFVEPIDPAFAQYLPANTSLLAQGADLTTSLNQLFDMTSQNDPTFDESLAELDDIATQFLGLTFSGDILGLLSGDYAAFIAVETDDSGLPTLMDGVMTGGISDLGFEAGFIFEATNPANAQAFVSGVQQLLPIFAAEGFGEGVTVTSTDVAGANAILVTIEDSAQLGEPIVIEVVIAANDSVVVAATRGAAEIALTGTGTLADNPSYQYANESFLGNATGIFYADQSGLSTVSSVVFLTLLGPTIGNIYEDIFEELDSTSQSDTGEASFYMMQDGEDPLAPVIGIYTEFISIFDSLTISTAEEDRRLLIRYVINFAP